MIELDISRGDDSPVGTSSSGRERSEPGAASDSSATAVAALIHSARKTPVDSSAVLPFQLASGDSETEYLGRADFSGGIGDVITAQREITHALSRPSARCCRDGAGSREAFVDRLGLSPMELRPQALRYWE